MNYGGGGGPGGPGGVGGGVGGMGGLNQMNPAMGGAGPMGQQQMNYNRNVYVYSPINVLYYSHMSAINV